MNAFKPSQSSTPIVLNLIIINVIVFLAQIIFDKSPTDPYWLTNLLALHSIKTGAFEPYQLVTTMFAHGGWMHLFFNMYAMWLFGSILERSWGPKKFLIFYFACGIAAGVAQLLMAPYGSAVGASGAIMGLLAAFAFTYPNIEFFIIPIPFPIKAKWMAVAYAAFDIFGGFGASNDGIAHFAHLGGLVMGLILMIIWKKQARNNY